VKDERGKPRSSHWWETGIIVWSGSMLPRFTGIGASEIFLIFILWIDSFFSLLPYGDKERGEEFIPFSSF
jgi:hypothetical protein